MRFSDYSVAGSLVKEYLRNKSYVIKLIIMTELEIKGECGPRFYGVQKTIQL